MARLRKTRHNKPAMPKRISQSELDSIVKVVSQFPEEGAGVDTIAKALAGSLPRRTLQRRMALLVAQKRIIVEGRGRASRYLLPIKGTDISAEFPAVQGEMQGEAYLPISSAGEKIRQLVRQPIQNRHPVGYNRDFLDSYHPNDTFYLSSDIAWNLPEDALKPNQLRMLGIFRKIVLIGFHDGPLDFLHLGQGS